MKRRQNIQVPFDFGPYQQLENICKQNSIYRFIKKPDKLSNRYEKQEVNCLQRLRPNEVSKAGFEPGLNIGYRINNSKALKYQTNKALY